MVELGLARTLPPHLQVPQKVTPDHPGSPPDGWVRKRAAPPREPWSHGKTMTAHKIVEGSEI